MFLMFKEGELESDDSVDELNLFERSTFLKLLEQIILQ